MAELAVSRRDKDEIYWKILNSVIELDFKKGHQRWTISDLSRACGVSRPLIYYYFGKSRPAMLNEAIRLVGEEFFGLSPKRMELWSQGKIYESVMATREAMERSPYLYAFYLAHRFRTTEIGEGMRRLESQHFQKLRKYFPHRDESTLKAFWAILFGLVFAPNVSEESVNLALSYLPKKS